jgi:hypothetical protein
VSDVSAQDFPTVSALVRLRMLSEDARRRTTDTSDAGRHLALIGLDGACEYALWLAARTHGISLKSDLPSFPAQYHALVGALTSPRWEPVGWPAVEQLHRARNGAQHAALAADPAQLPIWSDAAWAFIDSLCQAAFRVPLTAILLSNAVRNSELRTYLRWSEEALASGPAQAFDLALEAFDQARRKWRAQRDLSEFAPSPVGPLGRPSPLRGAEDKFRELDVLLEVQPFASDIGEYFWLRRARQEFTAARWPPSEDDVRRSLLFVTSWIVRWEIFDQGYPEDQWEAHREGIEPPVVGDGEKIQILGSHSELLPELPGDGARKVAMYFPLANVPGRGRAPWGELLREALTESARDATEPGLFAHVGWDIGGTLELRVALASNPVTVGAILIKALDLAGERYDERLAEAERSEQSRKESETAFAELVASARSELPFFGDVEVVRDEWLNTHGWIVFIRLIEGAAAGEEVSHAVEIFRGAARSLQGVHLRQGAIAFQSCDITESVEDGIREAIKRCEEQVEHLRAIRSQQIQMFREFAASIRDRFGQLPDDGP